MLDNYTRVNDYTRMIKLIEISRVGMKILNYQIFMLMLELIDMIDI